MTDDVLAQAHAALDGVKHHGPWVAEGQEIWQIDDGSRFYLGDTWTEGQARFIAWARDGVPALIAEVERLRAQINAVHALADQLDREATAPGQYAEIRRTHAARIRTALRAQAS